MEIKQNAVQVASFTPVGVTLETIDVLVRNQEMDAVALYMAFAAIAEWQDTHSIKATKSFMLNRTGWGKLRYEKAKATLLRYGLVENIKRKDEKTKQVGAWYVKVNHIVTTLNEKATLHQNQEGGKPTMVENRDTSAYYTSKVLSTPKSTCEASASRESIVLKDEIEKLQQDKQQHIRVIGRYLKRMNDYYGLDITTKGQMNLAIRRHCKPAKLIADSVTPSSFALAMDKAFDKCKGETTLETVIKYLTK